jgi:hypothetical protein
MNSTKHSLRSRVLLPQELEAAKLRYRADLTRRYEPATSEEQFWVSDMAHCMALLDRCKELSLADLYNGLNTARDDSDWNDARGMAAEKLGKRLRSQPSFVAGQLDQSLHGAEWKIVRWDGIRHIVREKGSADPDLHRLACDLMGLPLELRSGSYVVPPVTDPAGLAALADDEIARLEQRKETVLARRDEEWQIAAADAMPMVEDEETRKLRLYEAMIRRWYGQSEKRLEASRQSRLAAAAGPAAQGPNAPPDSDAYAKMSDAAIRYQNERTVEAMGREHERWQAEQAQTAAHRAAATPPGAAPTPTPTPAPTATSPSSAPLTPRPTPPAPPSASTVQANHKPLNRFEQAEAKRVARKAKRTAAKEARRARRASR